MEERTLILSAQQGDLEAFNQLVLKYQDLLYRIATRILSDEELAADAVQEALISAFSNLASFKGAELRGWLARITVNACYDQLRHQRRRPAESLSLMDESGDEIDSNDWLADSSLPVETQYEYTELQDTIQRALSSLPEHFRMIVAIVDVEGFSYEEAAQTLKIPIGTVKSRLARARLQLRAALGNVDDLTPSAYEIDLPTRTYSIWS